MLNVLFSSFHFFIERDNAKFGQFGCLVYVVALIDCVFTLPIIDLSRQ